MTLDKLSWKPYQDKESCFWDSFKKEAPAELVFKLANDKGYLKEGVTVKYGEHEYTGKIVHKDNKTYYFVERKPLLGDESPERIAHQNTNTEYVNNNNSKEDYWKKKDEAQAQRDREWQAHRATMEDIAKKSLEQLVLIRELLVKVLEVQKK